MTPAIIDLLAAELPELHAAQREDIASKIKALLEVHPNDCPKCRAKRAKRFRK